MEQKQQNRMPHEIPSGSCSSTTAEGSTEPVSGDDQSQRNIGNTISTSAGNKFLSPSAPQGSTEGIASSSKSSEMSLYMEKLREIVPYAKNSSKLSKVQLIHSAIDYITDLQESLEARVRTEPAYTRPPLTDVSKTAQNQPTMSPSLTSTPETNTTNSLTLSSSRSQQPSTSDGKEKQPKSVMDVINNYFLTRVLEAEEETLPLFRPSTSSKRPVEDDQGESKDDRPTKKSKEDPS